MCDQIHCIDDELGVKRILDVLAGDHGAPMVDDAPKPPSSWAHPIPLPEALSERRPTAPPTLREVDPLIRQLFLYRDLVTQKTGDPT